MTPMPIYIQSRSPYLISTDKAWLDVAYIHRFLSQDSYWAQGRAYRTVAQAVENSLCFGLYYAQTQGRVQVGFARVVTDYATFGWLCDVFVDPTHRGQGLGKWLVESVLAHPTLRDMRRLILATQDAHGLYQQYGDFNPLSAPELWLERLNN